MENLKFRAWDKKHNEMIRVISINFDEKFIRGLTAVESNLDMESSYNFEDIELMQSTGLKDKDGVEIFEGDIVEEPYNCSAFRNNTLRSIEMYNGAWVARDVKEPVLGEIAIITTILRGAKVIGNIYENEDLLEE
ncbi:hypothetical protein HOS99_gp166 [Staphylococcus phage phiSA_BS1]|uniref:YopX protein domain-containing protein n=2 Tax=Baoshanvirus TaxID=2732969 RepID=A0A2P1MXW0_9CAUD|nr:hypothetical protein HOS99_gp166 [Staphylococcus phage phiSA_BS1]YP_009799893.1 hypothetical protein HOT02_gp052 [Staphylococcus phage phiSA_BS2]AVP40403.1 hypothetical protein [Staphylococcus phage phiSA_BS1]AVR55497.1 hypothetical protein phiSABS2_52 [Staphylococcus phage phiSA_BS2]